MENHRIALCVNGHRTNLTHVEDSLRPIRNLFRFWRAVQVSGVDNRAELKYSKLINAFLIRYNIWIRLHRPDAKPPARPTASGRVPADRAHDHRIRDLSYLHQTPAEPVDGVAACPEQMKLAAQCKLWWARRKSKRMVAYCALGLFMLCGGKLRIRKT